MRSSLSWIFNRDEEDDNEDIVTAESAGCTGAWKRIMVTDYAPVVNKVEYHYKSDENARGSEDGR